MRLALQPECNCLLVTQQKFARLCIYFVNSNIFQIFAFSIYTLILKSTWHWMFNNSPIIVWFPFISVLLVNSSVITKVHQYHLCAEGCFILWRELSCLQHPGKEISTLWHHKGRKFQEKHCLPINRACLLHLKEKIKSLKVGWRFKAVKNQKSHRGFIKWVLLFYY